MNIVYVGNNGLNTSEIQTKLKSGLPTVVVAIINVQNDKLVIDDLARAVCIIHAIYVAEPNMYGKAYVMLNTPLQTIDTYADAIGIITRAFLNYGGIKKIFIQKADVLQNGIIFSKSFELNLSIENYKKILDEIKIWLLWLNRQKNSFTAIMRDVLPAYTTKEIIITPEITSAVHSYFNNIQS